MPDPLALHRFSRFKSQLSREELQKTVILIGVGASNQPPKHKQTKGILVVIEAKTMKKDTGTAVAECSPDAPDVIVRKFMPLVRQIARRYSQYNPDSHEDLVQVGSIGLLKAIKYYDPNRARSASFKTLATCYIRGEIRHYLRDHASLVQVPRKLTEMNSQLSQLEEKLTKQLDRAPTVQELAVSSGYTVAEILEAQQSWEARVHYESFDSSFEEEEREDRRSLSDLVADKRALDQQHASEERELVAQALKRLGERTREIVEFVFFYDLSQKETATVLGLSEMGVSRAVHSGLKKLRDILKAEGH